MNLSQKVLGYLHKSSLMQICIHMEEVGIIPNKLFHFSLWNENRQNKLIWVCQCCWYV